MDPRSPQRPIRVCGMVRNQGEPGGGPFIVREHDGSSSLQILESSQIDMEDAGQRAFFEAGGYFNPVDLVCSIRDYKGQPFDLTKFVNPKTASSHIRASAVVSSWLLSSLDYGMELCMTGTPPLSKCLSIPSIP